MLNMKKLLLVLGLMMLCMASSANEKPSPTDSLVDINGKTIAFYPFEIRWENSSSSVLNLASTLDAPAGRDGFVTVENGHFVKPDGERFRAWGVNLAFGACFPDKEDAPAVAAYLARLGVNVARLHFLDAGETRTRTRADLYTYSDPESAIRRRHRGLLDNGKDDTRSLSEESLDYLDYFVNELKKAGIYVNINLNVGRVFRAGDDVPQYESLSIAKASVLFDDRLIELQKEYAGQLLCHVNPYTGNAYADEPAVLCVEIVNENSLVEAWKGKRLRGKADENSKGTWTDIPSYYADELTAKYNQWLRKNLTPYDVAAIAAEAGVSEDGVIPRLDPSEFSEASELRFHSEARFIIQTERDFYTGMYDYLKDVLKVRSLVAANSDHNHYENGYALLSSVSLLDFVDGHVYWHDYANHLGDAPGKERWARKDNLPMVSVPEISTVARLSRSAVEGMPFTISEANNGNYNDYHCEGIPAIGAYASLQDWDGFYCYSLSHYDPKLWNTYIPNGLDIVADPIRLANLAAYGLIFRKGYLSPARTTVYRGYDEYDRIEGIRDTLGVMPFFTEGFSPMTPLLYRTRIASFSRSISDYPEIEHDGSYVSETEELVWNASDDESHLTICAPECEAFVGFVPDEGLTLSNMTVDIDNGFASVTLVSLDEKPISKSEKMLLVTTARSGFTGMEWTKGQSRQIVKGTRPVTIEPVRGRIGLSGLEKAKAVVMQPLDGYGNPLRSVSIPVRKGNAKLEIGDEVTVWYMLTIKR